MRKKTLLTVSALLWTFLLCIIFYIQPSVRADLNISNNQQPSGSQQDQPTLTIARNIPVLVGQTVDVPIEFQSYGRPTSGLVFSIDFDQNCLQFNGTDQDGNGIADGITFNLPSDFRTPTKYDAADESGEIDVIVSDFSPPAAVIPDGIIATMTFTALCSPPPGSGRNSGVLFSTSPAASFSDPNSRRIIGQVHSGSVIIYSGFIPTATPTITPGGPTLTPTSQPTQTPFMTSTPTSLTPNPSPTPTATSNSSTPSTSTATTTVTPPTPSAFVSMTPTATPSPSPTPFVPVILEFPITLQNGSDSVASANFTLEFNNKFLEYENDIQFNVPPAMDQAIDSTSSSVEVVLYTFEEIMPTLTDGVIATVRLRLKECPENIIADDLQLTDYSLGTINGENHPTGALTLSSSPLENVTCPATIAPTVTPSPTSTFVFTPVPISSATPESTPIALSTNPTILVFFTELDHMATQTEVELLWQTISEVGVAGFHIWRGLDDDRRSAEQVTAEMIPSKSSSGGSYNFTVPDSDRANGYRYWLEVVTADGRTLDVQTLFVPAFRVIHFYLPVVYPGKLPSN